MFRIKVEHIVEKEIEHVFDVITDHVNYKNFPGIDKSILLEEGVSERNGEGALRIIGAGLFELKERITHFERPSKMHYQIEASSPIAMRHDKGEITLEPVGDNTRVLWVSEGHMNVPLIGNLLLDKIIEMKITKSFQHILNAIERTRVA